MNIRQLLYIPAISSYGNLSAAAKALGITQPALSHYLSELEQELGVSLFYRQKKKCI